MKKLTVWILLCALLLSLGAVAVNAEDMPNVSWTPGTYAGESFAPVGDVIMKWDPDFSAKVDLTDGDIREWEKLGLTPTDITPENMISWVGGQNGAVDPAMPANWGITAYAAADPTYLYLAFDITDDSFAYGVDPSIYDGDAIQLGLDLGGLMEKTLRKDVDTMSSLQGIFYSFSCCADGAPLVIQRQQSDNDGPLSEANGDPVKGAAGKTDKGWSVELALSFELLHADFCWKAWREDAKIYIGSDEELALEIGLNLCYLDREVSRGEVVWAASTATGYTDDAGVPLLSWTAYDNGATLVLPYEQGMRFDCEFIVDTPIQVTTAPETEPPYEPDEEIGISTEIATESLTMPPEWWAETEPVEWKETIPPEVEAPLRDAAEDLDKEAELNAILEKYGCTSTLGLGSLAVLLTMAAAAYVTRKKK